MFQRLISMVYPPQCTLCDSLTAEDFSLCGSCWRETPFIDGTICRCCGVPLPDAEDDEPDLQCDACLTLPRPWSQGRAALVYEGKARQFVLGLKHGDRTELARTAGPWLARAGRDLFRPDMLVLPIPLHRFRLLRRKYNQAALLSTQLCSLMPLDHLPDGLERTVPTQSLDRKTVEARFETLQDTIRVAAKHAEKIKGRSVLLVDDVMTSGATLTAAANACRSAGASDVCVLALARTMKDD